MLTKPIPYDTADEMHRHVKLGRPVLASLILSRNKESNIAHIYPPGCEPFVPQSDEADLLARQTQGGKRALAYPVT